MTISELERWTKVAFEKRQDDDISQMVLDLIADWRTMHMELQKLRYSSAFLDDLKCKE